MIIFIILFIAIFMFASIAGWAYYGKGTSLFAAFMVIVAFTFWGLWSFGTETNATFTVRSAERMPNGKNDKWIVTATNGETFQNTDAWFHGKTNSTDLQTDIVIGHQLSCKVNGKRLTLSSTYRNLLECTDNNTGEKLR